MAGSITHLSSNGDRVKGRSQTEPLQRFAEAKKAMGEIYNDLNNYVNELSSFYHSIGDDQQKFVPAEKIQEVDYFCESIKTIREMFGRDKMKVVFFGRTSNGKSSVINAMLHSKVLPQGMGHTTCCFLQVEGCSGNDNYYISEGSERKIPVDELDNVGHALSSENTNLSSMGKDSLLRVFYPKTLSKLLQNEVIIVDSPGIDVSAEFDSWIDKHCLNADVFVLVCNSEAILTQAEKNFFHRVSKKISRPNIFILNNRWENSNSESELRREQLRNQHQTRFIEFLSEELKVCSAVAAKERFYFISAREVLDSRLKAKGEIAIPYQQEGFQRRQLEFENFEANFEKCISKSAIKTKFEGHSSRAREIIEDMRHNLETVCNVAKQERQRLMLNLQLKNQELEACREHYRVFELKYQMELKRLRAEVHLKVSADFYEEISRLESIFDRFKCEFGDDRAQIERYKQELADYADKVVTTDLQNLCTGGLTGKIFVLENFMFGSVKEIVGSEHVGELDKYLQLHHKPFAFTVNIDCARLVRDFHEDLEFRFSLGIESIARRVLSMTRGQPITAIGQDVVRLGDVGHFQADKNDVDTFIARVFIQSATYLANGSVGIALAGLIIYKNVDWRWIAGTAGVVGTMYAFERYKWNTGAKEERLKDQLRSHLEQRMQQVEHMHTVHCETQVVNELNKTFENLKSTVASVHRSMKGTIDKTKKSVEQLDEFMKGLTTLKGKTNFVSSSLESFATMFLTPNSPK